MIGRSQLQDLAQPVRDGRALLGADTVYAAAKSYPSRLQAQTPAPAPPPWRGQRGSDVGGLLAAPRAAMVNIENMLPVIVVRQGPVQNPETGLLSRLRSSYALLPMAGGSQ